MITISSQLTSAAYTDALTIIAGRPGRVAFSISNNDAIVSVLRPSTSTPYGTWSDDLPLLKGNNYTWDGVLGVRFKSASGEGAATITATHLIPELDGLLSGGAPFSVSTGFAFDNTVPATVVGGNPVTGTITLASPSVDPGGSVFTLSSSDTTVATVPASVTIAKGGTSATYTITTLVQGTTKSASINATYNALTQKATVSVTPKALAIFTLATWPPANPTDGQEAILSDVTADTPAIPFTWHLKYSAANANWAVQKVFGLATSMTTDTTNNDSPSTPTAINNTITVPRPGSYALYGVIQAFQSQVATHTLFLDIRKNGGTPALSSKTTGAVTDGMWVLTHGSWPVGTSPLTVTLAGGDVVQLYWWSDVSGPPNSWGWETTHLAVAPLTIT